MALRWFGWPDQLRSIVGIETCDDVVVVEQISGSNGHAAESRGTRLGSSARRRCEETTRKAESAMVTVTALGLVGCAHTAQPATEVVHVPAVDADRQLSG